MSLKGTVDKILKEKHRSLSWLAKGIGKTFDGLRLALINESLKYKDIVMMANLLEVHPSFFFETEPNDAYGQDDILSEPKQEYGDFKGSLKTYKELVSALKDQVKDKERIISLLSEGK
jgi:hypothetical protein